MTKGGRLGRRTLLAGAGALLSRAALGQQTQPPPVVFVHGNGDSGALWINNIWRFEANGYKRNQLFAIDFSNQEALGGPPHNVSIYTADPATDSNAKSLYQGQLIDAGQSIVYPVPALAAGTYYFNCIVHPTQMAGTFVVK